RHHRGRNPQCRRSEDALLLRVPGEADKEAEEAREDDDTRRRGRIQPSADVPMPVRPAQLLPQLRTEPARRRRGLLPVLRLLLPIRRPPQQQKLRSRRYLTGGK
ncbi:unnamed protein product, partial [Linum tenue]